MTYSRLYKLSHNAFARVYFKGLNVRDVEWVKKAEEGTILPTEDARNVKRYFREVDGSELCIEPVLPNEINPTEK